jgi:hypothetical protein
MDTSWAGLGRELREAMVAELREDQRAGRGPRSSWLHAHRRADVVEMVARAFVVGDPVLLASLLLASGALRRVDRREVVHRLARGWFARYAAQASAWRGAA